MVPELTPPVERFHRVLLDEIVKREPDYLRTPFTVADIYQILVPYRSHRDVIGAEMNGDYEDALLRLLAGAGDLLVLESEPATASLREELASNNPNTGLFREYGDARVHLNPAAIGDLDVPAVEPAESSEGEAASGPDRSVAEEDPDEEADTVSEVQASEAATERLDEGDETRAETGESTRDGAEEPEAWRLEALGAGADPAVGSNQPRPATELEPAAEPPADPSVLSGPTTQGCSWCGDGLPDDRVVNFCPHCGTSTSLRPCRDCGEEMEMSWHFCVSCGAASADVVDA
jgi:hypothetical protein